MKILKFRFWKQNKLQGILELKYNSILDMAWEWDTVDQFIGLLDSHGKEVYEGDIIEYDNPNAGYGDPNTPYSLFMIVPEIPMLYENSDWTGVIYNIPNGEIVGNKYENPELMEKTR